MLKSTKYALDLLEVTASGHPQLLDFQLEVILKSPARSAVYELATIFDVPHDEIGKTVRRACLDLDHLERRRRAWRDPAQVLRSPNLAALFYVCRARLNRVTNLAREQRLEIILRRVTRPYKLARSRAWIEAVIGPMPEKPREGQVER